MRVLAIAPIKNGEDKSADPENCVWLVSQTNTARSEHIPVPSQKKIAPALLV